NSRRSVHAKQRRQTGHLCPRKHHAISWPVPWQAPRRRPWPPQRGGRGRRDDWAWASPGRLNSQSDLTIRPAGVRSGLAALVAPAIPEMRIPVEGLQYRRRHQLDRRWHDVSVAILVVDRAFRGRGVKRVDGRTDRPALALLL